MQKPDELEMYRNNISYIIVSKCHIMNWYVHVGTNQVIIQHYILTFQQQKFETLRHR